MSIMNNKEELKEILDRLKDRYNKITIKLQETKNLNYLYELYEIILKMKQIERMIKNDE